MLCPIIWIFHIIINARRIKTIFHTEKNYRILSMVLNEDDRLEEMEGDEDDENEQANLRGLEMEALIHILSMREMNKVHQ